MSNRLNIDERGRPSYPLEPMCRRRQNASGPSQVMPAELRALARERRAIARRYAPRDIPSAEELVADELFAAAQATGYRVAEDPFAALLAIARAVERCAVHRTRSRMAGRERL